MIIYIIYILIILILIFVSNIAIKALKKGIEAKQNKNKDYYLKKNKKSNKKN